MTLRSGRGSGFAQMLRPHIDGNARMRAIRQRITHARRGCGSLASTAVIAMR
jgi:hypothetical protein